MRKEHISLFLRLYFGFRNIKAHFKGHTMILRAYFAVLEHRGIFEGHVMSFLRAYSTLAKFMKNVLLPTDLLQKNGKFKSVYLLKG